MNNKKFVLVIVPFAIIAIIAIYFRWLSWQDTKEYGELANLVVVIGIGIVGVTIHFLKNDPDFVKFKQTFESLELMMLMVVPTIAAFPVLITATDSFLIMPITYFIIIGIWYVLNLIQTNKGKDQKQWLSVNAFYGALTAIGIVLVLVTVTLNPYRPQ